MSSITDKLQSKSWKTTAFGIGMICSGIGTLGAIITAVSKGGFGAFDWAQFGVAFTSISGGVGLFFAKDANVIGAPPNDRAT